MHDETTHEGNIAVPDVGSHGGRQLSEKLEKARSQFALGRHRAALQTT